MRHEHHPLLARTLESTHDGICADISGGTVPLCPETQRIKSSLEDIGHRCQPHRVPATGLDRGKLPDGFDGCRHLPRGSVGQTLVLRRELDAREEEESDSDPVN
jgi:hypothetical protein